MSSDLPPYPPDSDDDEDDDDLEREGDPDEEDDEDEDDDEEEETWWVSRGFADRPLLHAKIGVGLTSSPELPTLGPISSSS